MPAVTAAFHGVVYAQTDAQPVLLDATTGEDIPTSGPTPSGTPSDGTHPVGGHDADQGSTPDDSTPTPDDNGIKEPGSAFGSNMSLYDPKLGTPSPTAVTKYGGAYLQEALGDDIENEKILIVLKPTA